MLKFIDKHLEESILVLLLSLMSILIGTQVFMRYVLNDSLTWSEELARYCFIWATYIGISYGVRENAHIYVEAVTNRLPQRHQRYAAIFSHVIFIFFALLVMKEGYALSIKVFKFGQTSSSLGIPMAYIYLAPTVGFGLAILRLLQKIIQEIHVLNTERQL